jgi:hypothetical protein
MSDRDRQTFSCLRPTDLNDLGRDVELTSGGGWESPEEIKRRNDEETGRIGEAFVKNLNRRVLRGE